MRELLLLVGPAILDFMCCFITLVIHEEIPVVVNTAIGAVLTAPIAVLTTPCNQSDSYMYDMMLIDTLISPLFQIASEVLQFLFGINKLLLLWAAILDFRLPRSQTTMKQGSVVKTFFIPSHSVDIRIDTLIVLAF